MNIEKGSQITARHIQSGRLMFYRVVEERESGFLRLLNLNSSYIMNGFKTKNYKKIVEYVEDRLKCEIIKVSKN